MSSVAQMLRQAEALKASISDSSKTISETWVTRQKLEDLYKKLLLIDLEYALDKKVEQELWNHAFKNQITNLQTQAKDKQNMKRAEIQASLNLFLETASGFYLQFLQLICTTFKLDLPFRRKSSFYGIMKEKTPLKLKVTPPKKSSCLYVCQHCLVHLGDIARYRQQIDQAQSYYWHAAYLVPFNGQPYNQLAILEAAKGNKLSTVFYYIRSLAVKVPFPVAATNLEKLYAKLTKETPKFKGKLSVSEMITGFLQFHALVHLCTDLSKAEELSEKLATGLPAHITSQSFPWQVLVQIVAINVFAMSHAHQHADDSRGQNGLSASEEDLTDDEENCFNLVFTLTVSMLEILLECTPKNESKIRDYFTLPAVKLLLDWLKLNPQNFSRNVLKSSSSLWANLCKVLNCIQTGQSKETELDVSKYEELPLPEDSELRCFQPIEKAQSNLSYSRLPQDGLPSDVEVSLRCHRLLAHGNWINTEFPSLKLALQIDKAIKSQPSSDKQSSTPVKTVTLSEPDTVRLMTPSAPSPERKSNRQNVAIQAIIQKQAQNTQEKGKGKGPASPKYLLGVPTSEPVFMKPGGVSRQTSPQQPGTSPIKIPGSQPGVLLLKNQDPATQQTQPNITVNIQQTKSPSWQQQQSRQQPVSSWQPQQKQQNMEKWQQSQPTQMNSPQTEGQLSPWQQQMPQPPQLSPQTGSGQWQFPPPPQGFARPRSPMSSQPNQNIGSRPSPPNMPVQSSQGHMFSQGQVQGQNRQPRPILQNQGQVNSLQRLPGQFDHMTKGQGHLIGQNLSQGQFPQSQGQGMRSPYQHISPSSKENLPKQGDFPLMSGGDTSHVSSGQGHSLRPPMFAQPPPNTVPPFPNFSNPPPDLSSSNLQQNSQSSQLPGSGSFHSNPIPPNHTNFSHAPGTERPHTGRPHGQEQGPVRHSIPPNQQGNQGQMPLQFPHGPFINPFPGLMGLEGMGMNRYKSPLEALFGKPRFPQEEIPPNMADLIGTLTKMGMQPPRDNVLPRNRVGPSTFQGHAEGTPNPESFFTPQRSSSLPTVSIDLETKADEKPPLPTTSSQSTSQAQGTYSLFSGSPWLSSGDSKSIGSSPFSSESSSIRNSPDPCSEAFNNDGKSGQMMDLGLRFSSGDAGKLPANDSPVAHGTFFPNNMQSIWSSQGQSPLERLLELQKQQRQTEPH